MAYAGPDPTDPDPGYRHYASGAPGGVGGYGYSWSSAVGGTYGMSLSFRSQALYTNGSDHRAHGFPLRCLSEETGQGGQ